METANPVKRRYVVLVLLANFLLSIAFMYPSSCIAGEMDHFYNVPLLGGFVLQVIVAAMILKRLYLGLVASVLLSLIVAAIGWFATFLFLMSGMQC
jgi:hypothetical protein